MKHITDDKNILFITLDTLRYDTACKALAQKKLSCLARFIKQWEKRHSPGSFTYAAHQAFFAGFLPTPFNAPKAPRLFALQFQGSETTASDTKVFNTSNIIEGFKQQGYLTSCIGGVGFFNKQTDLGSVLPGYFDWSYWHPDTGVSNPASTEHQVAVATTHLQQQPLQKHFLFVNISAIHQPNYFYLAGEQEDSSKTQVAALEYVDSQLDNLFREISKQRDTFVIVCSDHGTAYGEQGFHGHRLAHEVIWTVPYAEFTLLKGSLT